MSNSYSLTNNYPSQNIKVINPLTIDDCSNFFSPIHTTPITTLPPGGFARGFSPKLPPQNMIQYKKKKKTLILDLDETLVHSSMNPFHKCADITLPLNFNGKRFFVYVLKRPFLEQFLTEMNLIYDIIIFTASLPEYSEPLLDIIDKNKVIKYRLNRSHCRHYQNIYIKDLKVINRNLKDMIIIDNNPESYLMNKENAIPILTWEDDENDNELIKLIPVLKYLAEVNDVRTVINQIVDRNNEKVDFNIFNRIIKTSNNLNNSIKSNNNLNIINNNIPNNNYIISNNNIINNNIISNKNIISNNNSIIRNKNIISNNNIISNSNINYNLSPKDNNSRNNKNNNNINYNITKKIYIKKEIADNSNISINKRISFPINTNNQYILNNKDIKPISYSSQTQNYLYPKDTIRKLEKKVPNLNLDSNNLNNINNINNLKQRTNTSPINQINVSNSTINIFNNKPEIKILVNGPSQKPDFNKIKKIKEENLTPIRTVKNKRILFSGEKKKNVIVTPIKDNYNNFIKTNQNFGKTNEGKITKTVSVRKLFEQSNHSFDNIYSNYDKNLQKNNKNTKIKNFDKTYNNKTGFAYNPNIQKFMKSNNVKNTSNILDNKIIKMDVWGNNKNSLKFLRNEKSMSDMNKTTKIKNIEVIKSKKNVKQIPGKKTSNINMKVKNTENRINTDFNNNNNIKLTKKLIMERESFNRKKFLKENFGIIDS